MNSTIFFIPFIVVLAFVLLGLSVLLGPHSPYSQKDDAFECGFSSFRGQNRTEFNISFFLFGLLFLLFDLEILLVYPYVVSSYNNSAYGLFFVIIFLLLLTAGFVFEFGRGALKIRSRQTGYLENSPSLLEIPSANFSEEETPIEEKPRPSDYKPAQYWVESSNPLNLYPMTQIRSYSTKRSVSASIRLDRKLRSSQDEFWGKVNSKDIFDNDNPFIIVNNFLNEHPLFSPPIGGGGGGGVEKEERT